jgi:hypothetical protein
VNFTLEFVAGFLEFPKALADAAGEFGKFFGPEKQQHNHEDENNFGPAGHGDG